MDDKTALEAAAARLHCQPGDFMAWAWRGANLVVIGPTGQKFVFTPEELNKIERKTASDEPKGDPPAPAGISSPKPALAGRQKGASRPGEQKTRQQGTGSVPVKTDPKKTPRSAPSKSKRS